jgi:transposase-like protein
MERLSRRGKIPQKDWPSIIARHEAGETLASIARTYDCSPPAISYIVSRSRKRNLAAQAVPAEAPAVERQLLKTHPLESREAAGPRSAGSGADRRQPAIPRSPSPMEESSGDPPRRSQSPLFDRNPGTADRQPRLNPDSLVADGNSAPRAAAPGYSSILAQCRAASAPPRARRRRRNPQPPEETKRLSLGALAPSSRRCRAALANLTD